MKNFIVAIDGPAASGKSTTARRVALHLGWTYVDSGAMYRAVTLSALSRGVPIGDEPAVERIARDCVISFEWSGEFQRVFLDGVDVTDEIRSVEVTSAVSAVSSYPGVRREMVAAQQAFAERGSVVMDGRDIGTAVFPAADIKVYLVASLDERTRRRKAELGSAGGGLTEAELRERLTERDRVDSSRAHSPLRKAEDAMELDTSNLTIDDQVRAILALVEHTTQRNQNS